MAGGGGGRLGASSGVDSRWRPGGREQGGPVTDGATSDFESPQEGPLLPGCYSDFCKHTFTHIASHPPHEDCRAGFCLPISQVRKPRPGVSDSRLRRRTRESDALPLSPGPLDIPCPVGLTHPGLSSQVDRNAVRGPRRVSEQRTGCWEKGGGERCHFFPSGGWPGRKGQRGCCLLVTSSSGAVGARAESAWLK